MGTVFTDFPRLMSDLAIEPLHLVHVGAHRGEEMPFYAAAGIAEVTLVEPIPELAMALENQYPFANVVQAACGRERGTATLSLMRKTNLSTLNTPAKRDNVTGSIEVAVLPLSEVQGDANIAVIDAQGLEVEVLRGANLQDLDLVIVETCTVDDPTIAARHDDVVRYMDEQGWEVANIWSRDYAWIATWARGRGARYPDGQVNDVAFVPKED